MRICSPQLGISPGSILGGEIYDREILLGLARSGATVEVILPLWKPAPEHKNLHLTRTHFPFVYPPYLFNLLVVPYLIVLYRRKPFDILRIHSPTYLGLAALIVKKLIPHLKIIGVYHWIGEGGVLSKFLDPYIIRYFDAVICDSNYTRKQLANLFPFSSRKVYTIHNGVDQKLFKERKSLTLRKKLRIGKNFKVLLFMGLFTDRKNPLFLIEIMKKLISKQMKVVLLLCGNGELESKIRSKIKGYNLENYIQIISPVFGKEKNTLLNSVDIFVHPAKNEGFSLSVIEAMAVGLPVLITDGFSAREAVLHKVTGFCCKNEIDWIKNLTLLVNNESIRLKMSAKSILRVQENFTWKKSIKKHLVLYSQINKKSS